MRRRYVLAGLLLVAAPILVSAAPDGTPEPKESANIRTSIVQERHAAAAVAHTADDVWCRHIITVDSRGFTDKLLDCRTLAEWRAVALR